MSLLLQDEIAMLNDRLRVTLAGRYTTATNTDPYSGKVDASRFTPRAGLSLSIDKNLSIYAVYDQSFVPQAGSDYYGNSFKPVTGSNKEIGVKYDWFDSSWVSSLSLYQIVKTIVLTADPEHTYFRYN